MEEQALDLTPWLRFIIDCDVSTYIAVMAGLDLAVEKSTVPSTAQHAAILRDSATGAIERLREKGQL